MNSNTALSILSFRYYLRYFSIEAHDTTTQWWYNRRTGQVEHSNNYTPDDDCPWLWLPVPLVDVITLEKSFLKNRGMNRIVTDLENETAYHDFDVAFKTYIDHHGLSIEWRSYESQALENAAIAWCDEHHIKYQK